VTTYIIKKIYLDTTTGLYYFRKDRGVPTVVTKQQYKKWSAELCLPRVQSVLKRRYLKGIEGLFEDDWWT
jgi:hypothetical protein